MNISLAFPEIFLLSAACVLLLVDVFLKQRYRVVTYILSLITLLFTTVFVISSHPESTVTAFNDMFLLDSVAVVLKSAALIVTMAVLIYSRGYLQERNIMKGEYFILVLLAALGMMIMISANTLLLVYLGLELLSLSLYALVALRRDDSQSSEAAMKYFVLGAIASGMLLYGMSILYGLSGHLGLSEVATYVASQNVMQNIGILFGLTFIIVGLGFKLGAVPFHMWVPDVYHGAPTAITLFISSAPKIAVIAMVLRLLVNGMPTAAEGWQQMMIVLAIASLIIGNLVAIAQTNIKRMLAYSAIAHMGFVLLGVLSATQEGYSAAVFYGITYAMISMGGFAFIIAASNEFTEADQLSDYAGLGKTHPWYSLMMVAFLFAMAGVPPLVGFYAKFVIIQSVVSAGFIWLAVLAVITSVIGAFYYLRMVKILFFDNPPSNSQIAISVPMSFSVLFSANGLLVLLLGIFPGLLMSLCIYAVQQSF